MEEKSEFVFLDRASYFRFSADQLEKQKRDLAYYIITELATNDLESIQRSIADVKEITGYDISVEEAIKMRRLAVDRKIKKFCKIR